jgi:hypothetical protein
LPQGFAKKIELHLLLANLALKLTDALARRRQIIGGLKIEHPGALAWPARRPQCLYPTSTVMPAPLVQLPARYP